MKPGNTHIIRVKKRGGHGHGGGHGGSWKIAYADFMTAMMAFFLVMWLISISSPQELTQIAEYFRTPLKTAINPGTKPGMRPIRFRAAAKTSFTKRVTLCRTLTACRISRDRMTPVVLRN